MHSNTNLFRCHKTLAFRQGDAQALFLIEGQCLLFIIASCDNVTKEYFKRNCKTRNILSLKNYNQGLRNAAYYLLLKDTIPKNGICDEQQMSALI